ncbi:MAG: class I SAM-dependent methyltransferase [Planctomycetota bacterium]|jgi:ubiquinone/menaquinone biosynthesis C-methylase UbiE
MPAPGPEAEWWKGIYDDFRQRTGFGNLPEARTVADIDAVERLLGLSPPARVLDLFCGTGRHCIELAKRGYDATGLDYSGEYLALARQRAQQRGVSPRFVQGDAREVEWGSGYDAIIVMWASFGFFEDEDDRRIVGKMSRALREGGGLYMELKNREWEARHFAASWSKQVDDVELVAQSTFDLLRSRLETTLTFRRGEEEWTRFQSWRLYSAHELKALLEDEGFEVIGICGNVEGGELTLESHLARAVARKVTRR